MINKSSLFVVNNIEQHLETLSFSLPRHSVRIIQNEEEGKTEFLLKEAKKAIKEAYIASNEIKYIFLCGESFGIEAQNSLLKVLEEPPRNIIFILITNSKNSILPTVLSRLEVKYLKTKKILNEFELDLRQLELKDIYKYLKDHQRITKPEAKDIVESILYSANKYKIKLNNKQLQSFSTAMKLLELNSRPISILTTLLLNLLQKR
jgi:DNA polymerase III subunit delta'